MGRNCTIPPNQVSFISLTCIPQKHGMRKLNRPFNTLFSLKNDSWLLAAVVSGFMKNRKTAFLIHQRNEVEVALRDLMQVHLQFHAEHAQVSQRSMRVQKFSAFSASRFSAL